jgi:hypothetical protein
MNTTRKARSKNTALKVIAVTKYTSLLDHTSNFVFFVRCQSPSNVPHKGATAPEAGRTGPWGQLGVSISSSSC